MLQELMVLALPEQVHPLQKSSGGSWFIFQMGVNCQLIKCILAAFKVAVRI